MKKKILYLDPGHAFSLENDLKEYYKENFDVIDYYDFTDLNLENYKCIAIPPFIDQEYMYTQKEKINSFLNKGNILVFSGNLFKPWIPGTKNYIPKEITQHKDYEIHFCKNHPIFEGVTLHEMSYRKGIAGFFARGFYPTPDDSENILRLGENEIVTYIDRKNSKGTILIHSGNDLFSYTEAGNTTGKIGMQTFNWVCNEYNSLQKQEK